MKFKSNSYLLSCLLFLLMLVAGTLTGCKSVSVPLTPTTETNTKIETTEVVKDTTWKIPADSSHYEGQLAVNELGQISISVPIKSTPGKTIAEPKVNIVDNKLTVDCETYAQELIRQWKEKNTTQVTTTAQKIPYPVEKEFSWWQLVQLWCGRVFLIGVGFLIGIRLLQLPIFTKSKKDDE